MTTSTTTRKPCPYTVGRRICVSGPIGHPGPHVWPPVSKKGGTK